MVNQRKHIILPVLLLFCCLSLKGQDSKVSVIAHRGGCGTYPENSLKAIQQSLDMHVYAIEVDVRMTTDSVLVIYHDNRLNRASDGEGRLQKYSFNQLQRLNLTPVSDSVGKSEKIPTLDEVFQLVNGQCKLILDIKKWDIAFLKEEVLKSIEKYNATSWCAIACMDSRFLKDLSLISPSLELHKSLFWKPVWLPIFIDNGIHTGRLKKMTYIHTFNLNRHFLNNLLIRKIKRNKSKINVWTVNDPSKFKRIIRKGADGIITDFPETLIN